jgi:hypothetical protein
MSTGRDCLWTAATNRTIDHPPGDIWAWRAMVELYWQGKTEEIGEKPVPMSQIPRGPTRARTRASAVRGRRLTAWGIVGRGATHHQMHLSKLICPQFYLFRNRHPHDGGNKLIWNVGQYLRDYMVQYPRSQPLSRSSPWEPQISLLF